MLLNLMLRYSVNSFFQARGKLYFSETLRIVLK